MTLARDVDHYLLQSRPRHWAHFDGLATEPNLGMRVAPRPPATRPSPAAGSPSAAMAQLVQAATAGDRETVRAGFNAPTPAAAELADAMTDAGIGRSRLWAAAVKRFGLDDRREVLSKGPAYLADPAAALVQNWTVDGHVAMPVSTPTRQVIGPGLRRVDGAWKIDLALPPATDAGKVRGQLEAMRQQAARMSDLARATTDGKVADVYALRDVIVAGRAAATAGPTTR